MADSAGYCYITKTIEIRIKGNVLQKWHCFKAIEKTVTKRQSRPTAGNTSSLGVGLHVHVVYTVRYF